LCGCGERAEGPVAPAGGSEPNLSVQKKNECFRSKKKGVVVQNLKDGKKKKKLQKNAKMYGKKKE